MLRFFLSVLTATSLWATTYYVAIAGNDTNPGTISRPWRTINKAATTLLFGDSVLIRSGIYKESVNPARSGTAGARITYASYGLETVIVDGGEVVTNWVQDSGNRYRAAVNFTASPRFMTSRDPRGTLGGLVVQNGCKMHYGMAPSRMEVDQPGEYYMNDSSGMGPPYTMYVYVRDFGQGSNPNNYQMVVGRQRKGFDLDGGEDYLTVDGLVFRNYNDNAIHSIGSVECVFRNLKLYTNFITGIYLTGSSRAGIIERCSFWDNGHGGIELARSNSCIIRRTRFTAVNSGDGLGGNGAHMWLGPLTELCDSCLIENNIGFTTGSDYITSGFIVIRGNRNTVRHNSAVDFGSAAIALLDGGYNTVVNNAVDCNQGMACINVAPEAVADSGHYIRYNDFYALDPTYKYRWNGVNYSSLLAWEIASGQSNNIDSVPRFARPDSENLHLLTGSPCIDRGTAVNAAAEDHDGLPRPQGPGFDMGAYEFVAQQVGEECEFTAPHMTIKVWPNPSTGDVLLCPQDGAASGEVNILDVTGRLVRKLRFTAPAMQVKWDRTDQSNRPVSAGLYYAVLFSRGRPTSSTKITVLRLE